MIDLRDEILIDFIAEAEDYYQIIQQAISLLRQGQAQGGVDAMLRPLHTIKGTSGFIPGLEKLKTYTHQLEDILKQIQGRRQPLESQVVDALIRAVDEVFNLLEQVKRGQGELDDQNAQEVLAALHQALEGQVRGPSSGWFPPRILSGESAATQNGAEGRITAAVQLGVMLVRVEMPRLHLAWQCSPLAEAIAKADPKYPVAIDLSAVRTISSTAWGEIWEASMGHEVTLIGLRPAVLATFQAWGLDARMHTFADEAAFWDSQRQTRNVSERQ